MKKMVIFSILLGFVGQAFASPALEKNIEDHFRIHIIQKERRNPGDRVVVRQTKGGNQATLFLWRNLEKRNPADVICEAYVWFIKGRTKFGKGLEQAFSKFSTIDYFELRLFDLEFSTKRGSKKGDFLPDSKPKEYMRIGISRESAKKNNLKTDWVDQQIKEGKCPDLKNSFDEVWFDQQYIKDKSQ